MNAPSAKGKDAAHRGARASQNPYPATTQEHREWLTAYYLERDSLNQDREQQWREEMRALQHSHSLR